MWKRPLQKENINANKLIAYLFISASHMMKMWCYRHCLYHFCYISIFRRLLPKVTLQEISLKIFCRKYNASKCLAFWSLRFAIPSIVWLMSEIQSTIHKYRSIFGMAVSYAWLRRNLRILANLGVLFLTMWVLGTDLYPTGCTLSLLLISLNPATNFLKWPVLTKFGLIFLFFDNLHHSSS